MSVHPPTPTNPATAPEHAEGGDRQRVRASQALMALVVYTVFAGVQHIEVLLGLIDERSSWWLTAFNLGGGVGFYLLIRSGWNQRVHSDPSLTVPQSLWALAGVTWSYAITGPARGGVLLIVMLVLMYGIFALTPRQSRLLAGAGFAMLATAMVWKGWTEPQRYDPRVEGLHLVFAAIVTAAVAVLAERMGRLRARLIEQRSALAQALERIQALATRDELTGLVNRRAARESLQSELRRRDRAAPTLAVGLIDLDHFKQVNDQHGHAAGDEVLRAFARLAQNELRLPDRLARWGGEEFLLIMPGSGELEGAACLERLRQRLAATAIDAAAPGLHISFSAGVATCAGEDDIEPAIERADRALYEAKHRGRNRVLRASTLAAATDERRAIEA